MRHLRRAWLLVAVGTLAGLTASFLPGGRPALGVGTGSPEPQQQAGPAEPAKPAELKTYTGSFDGVVGRTIQESRPSWPAPLRAKPGSPNVLYIVLDDVGFGQLGCFGGPVSTPNLDRLAAQGLRYTNFHTTALCSPTRSCFLTGRNHHSNHMACITEGSTGFPGSDGQIPRENGFLSEILVRSGYSAFAVGKWHLTPDEETNMAARKDRWPLGRGFERFYGFLGGETHQYYPELVYDNHPVDPPSTPEQGYHLTVDLTDKAIGFVRDQKAVAPDKPFFLYYAPGTAHAPHHAPKDWIAKYKGKFDQGWDKVREETFARQKAMGIVPPNTALPPRNAEVKAWDAYGTEEHRLFSRFMEVFAAFLSHADDQIGRLVADLEVDRPTRQHVDLRRLRQRRECRRGRGRLGQREYLLQCAAGEPRGQPEDDRRAGRAAHVQPLPVRLDHGRQRPVPEVEAGDPPGRGPRPSDRPLAQGHQGERGDPHAVRPGHRPRPDRPGRLRRRAARLDQRRDAIADRGGELRPHLRRREGEEPARDAILRDVRLPRASTTTAGPPSRRTCPSAPP